MTVRMGGASFELAPAPEATNQSIPKLLLVPCSITLPTPRVDTLAENGYTFVGRYFDWALMGRSVKVESSRLERVGRGKSERPSIWKGTPWGTFYFDRSRRDAYTTAHSRMNPLLTRTRFIRLIRLDAPSASILDVIWERLICLT